MFKYDKWTSRDYTPCKEMNGEGECEASHTECEFQITAANKRYTAARQETSLQFDKWFMKNIGVRETKTTFNVRRNNHRSSYKTVTS